VELLERDEALATLTAARMSAARGAGRIVIVPGEPGIGKPALLGRFVGDLDASARVLVGACDGLSVPRPLGPSHDLVGDASSSLVAALASLPVPVAVSRTRHLARRSAVSQRRSATLQRAWHEISFDACARSIRAPRSTVWPFSRSIIGTGCPSSAPLLPRTRPNRHHRRVSDRQHLRTTFEEVPGLYDRARPGYPPQIFDDLAALAELPPEARLVEIGCGTGQATVPLAERGYAITCVELGERLAATARRKLATFPNVTVVNADFETWQPHRGGFDAVVAFSAFHWLAPDLRYTTTAGLLREHGKLGFVSTAHVLPADGDPFFLEVQADYDAVMPHDPRTTAGAEGAFYSPPWRLPHPDAIGDHSDEVVTDEIATSRRFHRVAARRYLWDVIYTADDYIAVLSTYSHHRALDDEARERVVERIHRRIEGRPERSVRTTYLAMLYVAERV
jgi:SAM-dependent methyltransferase